MTTSLLHATLSHTKKASTILALLSSDQKNNVLKNLASELVKKTSEILEANKRDLEKFSQDDPMYDRLLLTEKRIRDISEALLSLSNMDDPIGEILEERILPNQISLKKVRVPLGVVGVIYESRPNVTVDVFGLCFKTGNACVLKGSSSAKNSNESLVHIIHHVLQQQSIPESSVILLDIPRDEMSDLWNASEYIDVLIPRGGKNLIETVRRNSRIPVIETGAGVVHTYFSEYGNTEKGRKILFNEKTRRPSVCNSLDTLVIHHSRLNDLPELLKDMEAKEVEVFSDEVSFHVLNGKYSSKLLHKANDEHFGTEFLCLKMSVKTVKNLEEALDHIAKFSSRHSESIVSEDNNECEEFLRRVDSATVYANVSTAFTDGGEFGLGAEIGISTQKLHARGPMGLKELTSYKWQARGNGQVRVGR